LIFVEKKTYAKMSQNFFKIVWCIENGNINIQWNFHVSIQLFVIQLQQNEKIATWEIEWNAML